MPEMLSIGSELIGTSKPLAIGAVRQRNNSPGNEQITVAAGETIELIKLLDGDIEASASLADAPGGGLRVEVSDSGDLNCYALPWRGGAAYLAKLQSRHDLFVTPKLNGCGFIVAGDTGNPTVVHANTKSDRLVPSDNVQETYDNYNAVYGQVYGTLAAQLIEKGHLPSHNLQILKPDDYLDPASSMAAVFGVCHGSWKFYYNCRNTTKELWPNFER